MRNKKSHSISTRRGTLAACLLTFAFLLTQPDQALAQCTCPWITNGNNINNTNTGNVGIGTTTPGAPLHVATQSNTGQRGIFISHHFDNEGSPFVTLLKSRGTLASPAAVINGDVLGILLSYGHDGTSYVGGSHIRFTVDGPVATGSVPAAIQFFTGSSVGLERMRITSAGNVGIGTTNPAYNLHVVGPIFSSGPQAIQAFQDRTSGRFWGWYSSGDLARLWNGTTDMITVTSGGNVGIGTPNPAYNLHVVGAVFSSGPQAMHAFQDRTSGRSWAWYGSGDLTRLWNGTTDVIAITPAGKVGIGTTAPSSNLHVVGDVTLTGTGNISASGTITAGNIVAKYQDIAEWVPSRQTMPAGTVVVLDTNQLHYVQASSQAYDTRVAGVVSDSPGVILGEAGEGRVKVATTGRVRVKVDATRAPIRVGDLLVTSDRAGIAMRSEPLDLGGTPIHRPGTIIGKALEPLDKGVGEILVLLSLQ